MTDGHTKCFGVEVNPKINRLTLDTPPGTKIRFATSEIQVLNGSVLNECILLQHPSTLLGQQVVQSVLLA